MAVEAAWVDAVATLRGDVSAAEASARSLAARYRETHRRYHTTSHVEAVLRDAARLATAHGLDQRSTALLALAACAHDVVYDARPGHDERASAQWARHHLTAARVDEDACDAVAALVLTTLTHSFGPDDVVAALLCDADLAILGAEASVYDAYSVAVRQEFSAVPDDLWAVGRREVLERLLAKPRLFATEVAFVEWEAPARDNIHRELLRLPVANA